MKSVFDPSYSICWPRQLWHFNQFYKKVPFWTNQQKIVNTAEFCLFRHFPTKQSHLDKFETFFFSQNVCWLRYLFDLFLKKQQYLPRSKTSNRYFKSEIVEVIKHKVSSRYLGIFLRRKIVVAASRGISLKKNANDFKKSLKRRYFWNSMRAMWSVEASCKYSL